MLQVCDMEKTSENLKTIIENKDIEIHSYRSKISLLNSELARCENVKDNELRKIKEQCKCVELQSENIRLKQRLKTSESLKSELTSMEHKNIMLEEEITKLKRKCDKNENLKIKLKTAEDACESLSERINKLETTERKLEIKSKECDSLSEELKNLIKDLDVAAQNRNIDNRKIKYSDEINSGSDSDDSYYGKSPKQIQESSPNSANNSSIKSDNSDSMKDMLKCFKEELQAERAATLENQEKGMNILQKNFKTLVGVSDITRILKSIKNTLKATDIRMAHGAGLYHVSNWIRKVEMATKDDEARKSMIWLKAESGVITLIGGESKCSSYSWEDIKKHLKGAITETDPIEVLQELRRHHWLGHEDPLAFATSLRDRYDCTIAGVTLPKSYEDILFHNLTKKMNNTSRSLWRELLSMGNQDSLIKLAKVWNTKGRSHLFDDEDNVTRAGGNINTVSSGSYSLDPYDRNVDSTIPTPNMPFPTMGVQRDSHRQEAFSREANTSKSASRDELYHGKNDPNTSKNMYSNPYRSQDVRYSNQYYQQHRRPRYEENYSYHQSGSQRREERKNETNKWRDWLCHGCSSHNQKYFYKCYRCDKEAQKHQIPPNSWQCRGKGCKYPRNYWIKDSWCYGCIYPNPAKSDLKPADYPFHNQTLYERSPPGTFRKTEEVIQPKRY